MWSCESLLLSPFVLAADLVLLLGSEVVLDVKCLANLLGRLALDHIGDGFAPDVKQRLDIEVVSSLLERKVSILLTRALNRIWRVFCVPR